MSDVYKKCHHCQTLGTDLRRCAGCYTVYYCSKQCQRSDWKVHKETCQTFTIESSSCNKSKRTAIQIEEGSNAASEKPDGNVDEENKMNEVYVSESEGDPVPIMSDVYKKCHRCQTSGANLQRCARCHIVYYCSRSCQRSDWAIHKRPCQETAIKSADHITSTTVSLDEIMDTVDAAPNPEAAKPSCFEKRGIRQTDDFMATSNSDTTGNEASGSTARRKTKGNCMECCKPSCTMMCTKCKVAIYCSKACQKKDWPRHKRYYKKANDARMPTKNTALTNDERLIIETMKARRQRFKEEESRHQRQTWNFSGPYERINDHLTPDMLTIHERPFDSFTKAIHATRTRYSGWNIIEEFDNIPEENRMFSEAFQKQCMKNVLVAFMFMYHDNAMRHAVFLKDSGDNITHVEFYLDHLGDNPSPYFNYADATPGNYIVIQNPLMHQFMDGQVGLRINNPSEVQICTIESLHM